MSLYASGYGEFTTKGNGIPERVLKELDMARVGFEIDNAPIIRSDGSRVPSKLGFLCYSGKFDEDDVDKYLDKLVPYLSTGFLKMDAEDGTHWKYVFNGSQWNEYLGKVCYEDEPCITISLSNENKLSFLHDLIDVFENFLEDKGIVIENPDKVQSESPANIYGTDYMDIESELEEILKNWGVLK